MQASSNLATAFDSIDYLTHKTLHGILGATTGLALSAAQGTKLRDGILGGAVGAIAAEVIAQEMMDGYRTQALKDQTALNHGVLTPNDGSSASSTSSTSSTASSIHILYRIELLNLIIEQ